MYEETKIFPNYWNDSFFNPHKCSGHLCQFISINVEFVVGAHEAVVGSFSWVISQLGKLKKQRGSAAKLVVWINVL